MSRISERPLVWCLCSLVTGLARCHRGALPFSGCDRILEDAQKMGPESLRHQSFASGDAGYAGRLYLQPDPAWDGDECEIGLEALRHPPLSLKTDDVTCPLFDETTVGLWRAD